MTTNSSGSPHSSDYEWRYEYYEDDEPVSFEGLKAHRYSIVIGFWVGLAVFVLFMFFVLTLLTKTGPPHPEISEPLEKHVHLTSCVEDLTRAPDNDKKTCLARPLLDESHLLFHCYINEEEQARVGGARTRRPSTAMVRTGHGWLDSNRSSSPIDGNGLDLQSGAAGVGRTDRDSTAFLTHFNIPNFVNSELSSTLGDDDLLLEEPPLVLETDLHHPHSKH
ncbi:melanocortin-2 receptor accessory protein 2A-like [Denticeps clupeoides]|uniref:Uncharacterized protein n=1 Tax=Denticeps clupeoides TaxID=299321 RepID=A0AAY4D2A6_9TELE|nr:melanocortin-2 receptor accessory protein 2 [Denticeps clupeoides]XP_028837041.1 melanocortin-2 receptor accessory protein 2 [Denticeps clupeoides]